MQSQFIQTNGIRMHVVTDGPDDGPSVVLLHGFPEFHYGWRKQVPALVRAGFRVIVPDQRGYNLSDKPQGVAAYRVETLARDILGLFDFFDISRGRLVGHDWGGLVAWTMAIHHPERLEKLAILNVPHPDVMTRFIIKVPRQRRMSWYVFFFQLPWLAEWVLYAQDYANLERTLMRSSRKHSFTQADVMEYKRAWSQKGALSGMLNWYRAAVRGSLRHVFRRGDPPARRVKVPTLMLWGRRDVALSVDMLEPSIEMCDQGRFVLFDRATHWVQHDEPDEINRHLIEFMG